MSGPAEMHGQTFVKAVTNGVTAPFLRAEANSPGKYRSLIDGRGFLAAASPMGETRAT